MSYTVFRGSSRVFRGSPAEAAVFLKGTPQGGEFLVFDDATGAQVDLDSRGTAEEIAMRYGETPGEARGRGRPRLGVVAREVTLLPRHWEWLNAQPGGASVALRRLVEEAWRSERGRVQAAQEAAYRFLSAMAGNLAGFEEAIRALFAGDRPGFEERVGKWPADVREYAMRLGFGDEWATQASLQRADKSMCSAPRPCGRAGAEDV